MWSTTLGTNCTWPLLINTAVLHCATYTEGHWRRRHLGWAKGELPYSHLISLAFGDDDKRWRGGCRLIPQWWRKPDVAVVLPGLLVRGMIWRLDGMRLRSDIGMMARPRKSSETKTRRQDWGWSPVIGSLTLWASTDCLTLSPSLNHWYLTYLRVVFPCQRPQRQPAWCYHQDHCNKVKVTTKLRLNSD